MIRWLLAILILAAAHVPASAAVECVLVFCWPKHVVHRPHHHVRHRHAPPVVVIERPAPAAPAPKTTSPIDRTPFPLIR